MDTRAGSGSPGGASGEGPVSIRGPASTDPKAAHALTHVSAARSVHVEPAKTTAGRRSPIPAPVLLLASGMAATVALVVLATALRSGEAVAALESAARASGVATSPSAGAGPSSAGPEAPRELATPAEIDAAKNLGAAGLEPLSLRFPKDPAVWRALLLAQGGDPAGLRAAIRAANRLLELTPESASDVSVRTAVRNAASGPPDIAAQAFDLMATRMGPEGLDLLYEVMITTASPGLKERARQLLADREAIERASPALRVALDLRAAPTCVAKKALLERAAKDGDRRAIDILTPFTVSAGKGCGFLSMGQCPPPCAGVAGEMRKAIEAIRARAGK